MIRLTPGGPRHGHGASGADRVTLGLTRDVTPGLSQAVSAAATDSVRRRPGPGPLRSAATGGDPARPDRHGHGDRHGECGP